MFLINTRGALLAITLASATQAGATLSDFIIDPIQNDVAEFTSPTSQLVIGGTHGQTGRATLKANTTYIIENVYIGDSDTPLPTIPGGNGTLLLSQANSHIEAQYAVIGNKNGSHGLLAIQNQSTFKVRRLDMALNPNTSARLSVEGVGSSLEVTGHLISALSGRARISVIDGGNITVGRQTRLSEDYYLDRNVTLLEILGQGSTFNAMQSLDNGKVNGGRGGNANASIHIADGGQLNVAGQYSQNNNSLLRIGISQEYLGSVGLWAATAQSVDHLGLLELYISSGYNLGYGQTYNLFQIDNPYNDTFNGIADNALIGMLGGIELYVSYTGGDGNDIILYTQADPSNGHNAIPEPATTALISLAMVSLAGVTGRRHTVG